MADCHDCEGKEIGENQQHPVVPENHGLPEMQNVKVAQNSQMRKILSWGQRCHELMYCIVSCQPHWARTKLCVFLLPFFSCPSSSILDLFKPETLQICNHSDKETKSIILCCQGSFALFSFCLLVLPIVPCRPSLDPIWPNKNTMLPWRRIASRLC